MAELLRRELTAVEAHELASWRYPPPFDVYDADPAGVELFLRRSAEGEGYYPVVDDGGALVAFAVLGAEARVLGQERADGVLDVGAGVRPDLVSGGLGTALVRQVAVLGQEVFRPAVVRTAVAAFNERSLALCRRAGFRERRRFPGPGGREFVELTVEVRRT